MADINVAGTLNAQTEDGTLARAEQIDVGGIKLPSVLEGKEDKGDIRYNIDTPLITNTEYYLGEIDSLDITLPEPIIGDMFYLTYDTGEVAFTPTITGTYQGLEYIGWLIPNATYELCGKSNGDTWLIAWKVSTK